MNTLDEYKLWESNLLANLKLFNRESQEIQLFLDFLTQYSESGIIPNFNSQFIPTTVHNFLSTILSLQPTDFSSKSAVQKLLNEIVSLLTIAITNNYYEFSTTLHRVFDSKAVLYRNSNPNFTTSQFLQATTNNYLKSNAFASLLAKINDETQVPNINHLYAFLSVLFEIHKWFDMVYLSKFISQISKSIEKFFKSFDTNSIRALDNDLLQNVMHLSIYLSSLDECFKEVCVNTLNFAIILLQVDILDKQLIGAKIISYGITELADSEEDSLNEWFNNSNIFNIFLERSYHESVINKFFKIYNIAALNGKINQDILYKTLIKSANSSQTQRKEYFSCIHQCFASKTDEIQNFVSYCSTTEKSEFLFDFMGFVSIFCSMQYRMQSKQAIDFLVNGLTDEKFIKLSIQKILEFLKYKISISLIQALFDGLSNLLKPKVDNRIIELLENVLKSIDMEEENEILRIDVSFADKITQVIDSDENNRQILFNILFLLVTKFKKKMTRSQIEILFKKEDNSLLDFLSSSLKLQQFDFLFPSAIEFLYNKIDEYDFVNANQSFSRLICSFELSNEWQNNRVVEANSKSSPTKKIPRYAPISLKSEFPMTLRLLQVCKNEDSTKIASKFLIEFAEQSRSNFGIDGFNFILRLLKNILTFGTDQAKIRAIKIILELLPKFEIDVTLEDVGIKRHHTRFETDLITAKIYARENYFDMKVNPNITVQSLLAKIAAKIGCNKDDISLFYEGKNLGRPYTLSQYGILSNTKFNIIENKRKIRMQKFPKNSLPSVAICDLGICDLLFEFLEKDNDKLIDTSLILLNQIPTAQKALDLCFEPNILEIIENSKTWQNQNYLLESLYESLDYEDDYEEDTTFCNDYDLIISLINKKIDIRAAPPALMILSDLDSPHIVKFFAEYFNIALQVFLNAKSDTEIESALCSFSRLQEIDNEKFSDLLFTSDLKVFEFTENMFKILISIINKMIDKTKAFNYLSKFVNEIEFHDKLSDIFFNCLCHTLSEESEVQKLVPKLKELLRRTTQGTLFVGIVTFLAKVSELQPMIIDEELSQIIIPRIIREQNETIQNYLIKIISISVVTFPSVKQMALNVLGECLSKPSTTFGFTSMEFDYKDEDKMCGLKNLGATCYLNSILQILFSDFTFRSELLKIRNFEKPWMKDLQVLFSSMQLSNNPIQSTNAFCKSFKINPAEQQDAVELYQNLLDNLPKTVCQKFIGKLTNIFEGINETFTAENKEDFFSICLDVKGFDCLEDSFESFISSQFLTGDDQYFAESLGHKIDVKKFVRISEPPEHLFIQLKRFEYNLDTYERYKVNDRFEFPLDIDISRFTTSPQISQNYKLTHVLLHDGDCELGHYYSLILIDGKWILFNDKTVGEFPKECFEAECFGSEDSAEANYYSPSAYCLIYTKNDIPHKYSEDNSVISTLIDQEIKKVIEEENDTFCRYESTYTTAFLTFILWLNEEKVLLDYFFNVYAHSNLVESRRKMYNSLILYKPQILSRFAAEKEHLLNILLHANDQIIALICDLIISKVQVDKKDDFIVIAETFAASLKQNINKNNQILSDKAKALHYLCRGISLSRVLIESIMNALFVLGRDPQIDQMALLSIYKEHVHELTEIDYSNLLAAAPNLLISINGTSLMAVFVTAAKEKLIDLITVLKTILSSADESYSVFLFNASVGFIPVALLIEVFKECGVTNLTIAKTLNLALLRGNIMLQAKSVLFDLLLDENELTRKYAEKFVKSCFPGEINEKTAELILNGITSIKNDFYDDFDDDSDDDMEMINYDDIDIHNFIEQITEFLSTVDIIKYDTGFRLTSIARTLQRVIVRQNTKELTSALLKIVEKLSKSDANKLEFLRALELCDEMNLKQVVDEDFIENFVNTIFPINFDNVECGCSLFNSSFVILKKISQGIDSFMILIMLPDFFESMVSFIEFCEYSMSLDFVAFVISHEELCQSIISVINDNERVVSTSKSNLLAILFNLKIDEETEIKEDLVAVAIEGGLIALSDSFMSDDSDLQSTFQIHVCEMIQDVSSKFKHSNIHPQFISDVVTKTISADASFVCPNLSKMICAILSEKSSQHLMRMFEMIKTGNVPISTLCLILPALTYMNSFKENKQKVLELIDIAKKAVIEQEESPSSLVSLFFDLNLKDEDVLKSLKELMQFI